MKSLIYRSTTPRIAIIIASVIFVIGAVFVVVSRVGAQALGDSSTGRLVTVHDRGVQTSVLTDAVTVGDALKQAGVTLNESDAVEPTIDTKLVANEYNVNVYRARPVIVIDGSTKQKVITPYQTGEQIAKSAGISLYAEDTTVLDRNNDIVSDGAGLRLTIDRSIPFAFNLYGTTSTARTQGMTVGEMLSEKGVILGTSDRVSPIESTALVEGLAVRVWREGKQTITVDEVVSYGIEQIQDGDQYIGYSVVKTPGQPGARSVTYEIVVQDGVEVGRTEIASITTTPAVNEAQIIGAKYRGAYTTPTENEVISWNFFIANGFSRNQTAGIMGNLMQEHRFNTTGDGLAQWTGGRKAALMALPDPYNIYTQLNFLMSELNGGYVGVRDAIKSSSSVEDAVIIFQDRFEKCGICAESNRIQYAYNILASH
jgi:resuscitation-promoting factor RpfB